VKELKKFSRRPNTMEGQNKGGCIAIDDEDFYKDEYGFLC
jgi:hypothetical protein